MRIRRPKNEGIDVSGDPFVECEMTGFKCRLSETVVQWDGRRVLKEWADPLPADYLPQPTFPNEGRSLGGGLRASTDTDVPNLPSGTYSDPWLDRYNEENS